MDFLLRTFQQALGSLADSAPVLERLPTASQIAEHFTRPLAAHLSRPLNTVNLTYGLTLAKQEGHPSLFLAFAGLALTKLVYSTLTSGQGDATGKNAPAKSPGQLVAEKALNVSLAVAGVAWGSQLAADCLQSYIEVDLLSRGGLSLLEVASWLNTLGTVEASQISVSLTTLYEEAGKEILPTLLTQLRSAQAVVQGVLFRYSGASMVTHIFKTLIKYGACLGVVYLLSRAVRVYLWHDAMFNAPNTDLGLNVLERYYFDNVAPGYDQVVEGQVQGLLQQLDNVTPAWPTVTQQQYDQAEAALQPGVAPMRVDAANPGLLGVVIAREIKAKYGQMEDNPVNRQMAREVAHRLFVLRNHRSVHIAEDMDQTLELVFAPSAEYFEAQRLRWSRTQRRRAAAHANIIRSSGVLHSI